jgi:hypothetical protein
MENLKCCKHLAGHQQVDVIFCAWQNLECMRGRTCAKEKSRVMLVSTPCFCSSSHARMPSHVDAICISEHAQTVKLIYHAHADTNYAHSCK